jgi:hypothetical protein
MATNNLISIFYVLKTISYRHGSCEISRDKTTLLEKLPSNSVISKMGKDYSGHWLRYIGDHLIHYKYIGKTIEGNSERLLLLLLGGWGGH